MIAVDEYAEFLAGEYLDTYVAGGARPSSSSSPPTSTTADRFAQLLRCGRATAATRSVRVDAVDTRIHMMDQVFFAVAGQVDWEQLAAHRVRASPTRPSPTGRRGSADLSVELSPPTTRSRRAELGRDVNRQLQHRRVPRLRHGSGVPHRHAAAVPGPSAYRPGHRGRARRRARLAAGRAAPGSPVLRSAMIFRRIGRHNARQLLFSTAHWLAANGRAGLLLELDVRRFGFARRPAAEERHGNYYTKAALLDGYELLRQLVDNTDELAHCCVVVVAGPELTADPNRGIDAYQALKLRIADDGARPQPGQPVLLAGPGRRGVNEAGEVIHWACSAPGGRWRRCAAGVPNRDAVSALGSQQTAVEDRFSQLLDAIGAPAGRRAGVRDARRRAGSGRARATS